MLADFDVSVVRSWMIVHLSGDLDVYAVMQLGYSFTAEIASWVDMTTSTAPLRSGDSAEAAARLNLTGVAVDLRLVPFVDSAGLGLLIATYRSLRDAGLTLHLISASENLRRLIQLMGLTEILPLYCDIGAAVPQV